MENIIVLIALAATAAGSLILLSCMAGKRAELVRGYTAKLQRAAQSRMLKQKIHQQSTTNEIPVVSEETSEEPQAVTGAAGKLASA
jgi:hypothetical protein